MISRTEIMADGRYFFDGLAARGPLSKIRRAEKIALFLDFDGTLVPIQKDPSQCTLSGEAKKQLRLLAASRRFVVTILSGRSLADIRNKVGIGKIFYGGNHGLEISGPGLRYTHPIAVSTRPLISRVKGLLAKEIGTIEGASLEDKKFSLTLHYRAVNKENIPLVRKIFYKAAAHYLERGQLAVIKGKKVLELAPHASWNKGSALLWMMKQFNSNGLPVYIGDDLTDETAFKALGNMGISVRVGKSRKTGAKFYLRGQWEVLPFLQDLDGYAANDARCSDA